MVSYLNQGKGNTCTIYALSNAVQDSLNSVSVNVDINNIIGALQHSVKNEDVINGIFPYKFQGFQIKNQINHADGEYGNISIQVKKEKYNSAYKHILVYTLDQIHPGLPKVRHCVFVKSLDAFGNNFHCINSWGKTQDPALHSPIIPVNTIGLEIYRVCAVWEPIKIITQKNKCSEICFLVFVLLTTMFALSIL